MKNKNGFTLVELLGVITILAVLSLIAVPTINSILTRNREKLYQAQIQTIKDGLKTWGDANALALPENEENPLVINLGVLKLAGFVDAEFTNPNTDTCFANSMVLTISVLKGGYNYYVDEESGLYGTENDCKVPNGSSYFLLNGSAEILIGFGETYTEAGIYIFDEYGNILLDKVIETVITDKDGNVVSSIDTSVNSKSPYTITYSYEGNSQTRKIYVGDFISHLQQEEQKQDILVMNMLK